MRTVYSMVSVLVFNLATFWEPIELFAFLFEFFHVRDASAIHFSLSNFSFRSRAQFYIYLFFS